MFLVAALMAPSALGCCVGMFLVAALMAPSALGCCVSMFLVAALMAPSACVQQPLERLRER
jgi:hypothetical protein